MLIEFMTEDFGTIFVNTSTIKYIEAINPPRARANEEHASHWYRISFLESEVRVVRSLRELQPPRAIVGVAGQGYTLIHPPASLSEDEKVEYFEEPIIAFVVNPENGSALPVTPDAEGVIDDDVNFLVRLPDGRIQSPYDRTYDSEESFLEAYKEILLERQRREVKGADA